MRLDFPSAMKSGQILVAKLACARLSAGVADLITSQISSRFRIAP